MTTARAIYENVNSSAYTLRNVSRVYSQCITVENLHANKRTQKYINLFSGYFLYAMLHSEDMKQHSAYPFIISDGVNTDMKLTFDYQKAETLIHRLPAETRREASGMNEMEIVVLAAIERMGDYLEDGRMLQDDDPMDLISDYIFHYAMLSMPKEVN